MESWTQLRRRSTGLFAHVHQSLPSMPRLGRPSSSRKQHGAIRATWQRVDGLPLLPRSSHSLDVVAGAAYIFGGELSPREPVDNDMLVISLPYSSAGADYYKVKAVAAKGDERPAFEERYDAGEQQQNEEETPGQRDLQDVPLGENPPANKGKEPATAEDQQPSVSNPGDVPAPRVGHATAVIGSRIFLFGGRGGPDMTPLDEAGRVWVFDTRSRTWTHLDPVPAVTPGAAAVPHPAARSYHCAAATEHPRDLGHPSAPRKPQTWRQWAVGDSARTGIPQDPVVGSVAEEAVDYDSEGYGTFLVHAGCLADGERTSDLWAFDVASRTWTELPAAPGPPRSGTGMSRLPTPRARDV
ncbi:galactose oxidase, central domain-containing protein [Hirsutella rhossiliensis]